jgi:hypothetical protein
MPIADLAVVGRAVMDRLAAAAESSGKYS